eukprot:7626294-Prorocentrum_lima.AAC.1
MRGVYDWEGLDTFPLQEGAELTLCMRLRGGDPGEESDRFELRLATGIQRLAQLRNQSSLPNNKLTDE